MDVFIRTFGTRKTCVVFLLLGLCGAAAAADIEREGPRLRVLGVLDGNGIAAFNEQLASGQVRTVVFEDSRGGTAEVAEQYAQAIRTAEVNTEVRGQCNAACAHAFLAGKEHRFGRGSQVNSLLVPLGARPETSDLAQLSSRFPAQSGSIEVSAVTPPLHDKVPPAVKEAWQPDRGVLFTSTPTLFGRVYNSYYCDGTQGRDLSRCEALSDADPYRLGILTLQ
jgi:hypothetical protein